MNPTPFDTEICSMTSVTQKGIHKPVLYVLSSYAHNFQIAAPTFTKLNTLMFKLLVITNYSATEVTLFFYLR